MGADDISVQVRYIKTDLCMQRNYNGNGVFTSVRKISIKDPYLWLLMILYRCDKSRKYNILGPFLDL